MLRVRCCAERDFLEISRTGKTTWHLAVRLLGKCWEHRKQATQVVKEVVERKNWKPSSWILFHGNPQSQKEVFLENEMEKISTSESSIFCDQTIWSYLICCILVCWKQSARCMRELFKAVLCYWKLFLHMFQMF